MENHVFELIRARLAEKEGITPEALWNREVAAKLTPPAEAEVAAMVRQYRTRLPADDEQAKKVIVDVLNQNRAQERERAWRSELLAGADFRLHL